ncbi:hypothetical protein V5O48_005013 [Marasmius crinis-equi]|uniref:Uncharacterized protein n=1 Tax=Marasmius crinis-equi TaxID=585013 RepID=A0ABR3FNG4_9AGAR
MQVSSSTSSSELSTPSSIPSVPSLTSVTTAATEEAEIDADKPIGWKRVFALGGLSRSSSLSSVTKQHRKSASMGGSGTSAFIRKMSKRKPSTATTTGTTTNTDTTPNTEIQHIHSPSPAPIPIQAPSPKRDFGLHIDLPAAVRSQPSTRPPSRSENLLRETLLRDEQISTTNIRRRTSTSSRAASRATSPESVSRLPMSPHEQVLRARLEHVLGLGLQEQEQEQKPRGRRYSETSAVRGTGIWGWLWPAEKGSEDMDYREPQSPITYLPTPQTSTSANTTSPPSASSTQGFFDSLAFSSKSRQGSFTSPPDPLSRSQTDPLPELAVLDSPRMLSKAVESLSAHSRPHSRSNSITNVQGLTRSHSVSSTTSLPVQVPLSSSPRMSPASRRKTPMFTLGLETVRSVADMRAAAAAAAAAAGVEKREDESTSAPSESNAPSSSSPNGSTSPSRDQEESEALITPPPTPPKTSAPISSLPPPPSRIPISVTRRTSTPVQMSTTPTRTTSMTQMPCTPVRTRTSTHTPTPTQTPKSQHRRALSVSVPRRSESSQSTPCTPQRTKEFLGLGSGSGSEMPRTPQPHTQKKQFLNGGAAPRRPQEYAYAVAPNPDEFRVVDNPASPSLLPAPATPATPSRFNIRTASAQCRAQEGYVSFAMVEGLGEPEREEGEQGEVREEGEKQAGQKGRRWLLF